MYEHNSTCVMAKKSRSRGVRRLGGKQGQPVKAPAAKEAGIREDLVARIRQEIAAGTYDTPERLRLAMERMIEDVT